MVDTVWDSGLEASILTRLRNFLRPSLSTDEGATHCLAFEGLLVQEDMIRSLD
jgi:hypothetical protein